MSVNSLLDSLDESYLSTLDAFYDANRTDLDKTINALKEATAARFTLEAQLAKATAKLAEETQRITDLDYLAHSKEKELAKQEKAAKARLLELHQAVSALEQQIEAKDGELTALDELHAAKVAVFEHDQAVRRSELATDLAAAEDKVKAMKRTYRELCAEIEAKKAEEIELTRGMSNGYVIRRLQEVLNRKNVAIDVLAELNRVL